MLKIWDFHDFALEESVSDFFEDLEDRVVEDDMIVLDLVQIWDEFVDLLFAYLESVV